MIILERKEKSNIIPYLHGLNSKTTVINFFLLLKLLPIILFLQEKKNRSCYLLYTESKKKNVTKAIQRKLRIKVQFHGICMHHCQQGKASYFLLP